MGKVFFQFTVDGRPASPIRGVWHEAAEDAVRAGYAAWEAGENAIRLHATAGGGIARITPLPAGRAALAAIEGEK